MDVVEAKNQFKKAHRELSFTESLNTVYASKVLSWKNQLMFATKKNKQLADKWIDG